MEKLNQDMLSWYA